MTKHKVLFFAMGYPSFVKKDVQILEKYYLLTHFVFNPTKKYLTPYLFLKQLWFLITHIKKADLLICQFAHYHSFLPALFGKIYHKPVLLLLAGTDCVSFPSINYGNFRSVLIGWFTKQSFRLATHLSPVHESLIEGVFSYYDADYPKQGYRFFCKKVPASDTVIYYGYNSQTFCYTGASKQPNSFVTITQSIKLTYLRKGIDMILAVAPFFPHCTFTIIGNADGFDTNNLPQNIKLIPFVPYNELNNVISSFEFYLQLSICEGFPNALCEAMLCECVPIGAKTAAIPFIIDDSGFIVEKKDLQMLKNVINNALLCDKKTLATKARQRITNNFTLLKREKELIALTNLAIQQYHK